MKISRIFKWLKGLSREDWAKNLCLKVLEKMPDEYLVYIEELKSGIIGHVLTDFRSIPYRYNFFFNTSLNICSNLNMKNAMIYLIKVKNGLTKLS